MKIAILNTHSVLNSGDMGIVLAQVRLLRALFTSADITLTSRTPRLDQGVYTDFDLDVLPPAIPAPSVFGSRREKVSEIGRFILGSGARRRLRAALDAADLVVATGGGYFYSHRRPVPGPMFLQNILHVRMAQRLGKPVVFFPQSFGPVFSSTGRRWLRDILSHETTHKIFARENRSFSYAARLLGSGAAASKLELCPDLAFTLEPGPPPLSPEGFRGLPRPIVALTLRSWDFPHTRGGGKRDARMTRYLDALELACRHIGRELGGSLLVFPQARGPGAFENDRIVSQQLHERLKPHLPEDHMCFLDPPAAYAPDRIMEALSHADLLIATRFHSAIFALLVRTPVVSIAYQPKASGMMEMLGLADHTLDAAELKPEEIIASIESILSDPSGYMGRAAAGIAALKNDAEERIRAGLSPFLEKSSS